MRWIKAVLCALLVAPAAVAAQQRIAVLGPDEQPRFSDIVSGLKQGLHDQSYGE